MTARILNLDPWISRHQGTVWDQRALAESTIYKWDDYWEWEVGGCGALLRMPTGAVRLSCGGFEIKTNSLAEAQKLADAFSVGIKQDRDHHIRRFLFQQFDAFMIVTPQGKHYPVGISHRWDDPEILAIQP